MISEAWRDAVQPADTKLVIYTFDGLGGLPNPRGRTELEDADTKHLDRMAEQGSLGQLVPVAHGITPGPATAFMALLGYDPATTSLEEGADVESFDERWGLKSVVVTDSERHVALSERAGLEVVQPGAGPASLVEAATERWNEFDCFIIHNRPELPDEPAERYAAKRSAIAEFDDAVPAIVEQEPEVLVVAGDRSAPAILNQDTWHPVPLLITGPQSLPDETHYFSELGCARGVLGTIRSCELMPLALAHAGRLQPVGP